MTTTTNTPATTLTAESFKLDLGNYDYNGKAIEVTNKITGFGSGKKTVYTGTIDGAAFENWDVCRIKKALGIAVSGTAKGGVNIRVMSDDEIDAVINAECNRFKSLLDGLTKFLSKYDAADYVTSIDDYGIIDCIEASIRDKAAAARAAKAEAERVAAEKAAEKVRAAKMAQASDLQKQMMDAVLAGDFAKLAELQKQAAEEAA